MKTKIIELKKYATRGEKSNPLRRVVSKIYGGILKGISRLHEKKQEVGVKYVLWIVIFDWLIPNWLLYYADFYVCVWKLDEVVDPRSEKLRIRNATVGDIELLCQFGQSPLEIQKRFKRGSSVCVMEKAGRLIAYHWVCPGSWRKQPWLLFTTERPDDVFSLDTRVQRSYRGRGMAGQVRRWAASRCQIDGYRRLICTISVGNRNSVRAAEKAGYRIVNRVRFLRVVGLTIIGFSGRRRFGIWTVRRPMEMAIDDLVDIAKLS